MSTGKKGLRVLSLIVFAVGVIVGLVFAALIIWANLEASLFDTDMAGDAALALHCPVVITTRETGIVSASFTNTATWDVNLTVKAHISQGHLSLYREEMTLLKLAPGQSQGLSWVVTPQDRVYGRIIFVKVANNRLAPIQGRAGTCGILVVNIPALTGSVFIILVTALAGLFLVAGNLLWRVANRPALGLSADVLRAMNWLTVAITADLVCGFLRAWLPGVLVFVISLLLIAEILRHYTQD